jgi:deazaflavin-dependent oxidoreductase (nitroreductase family)
MSDYNKQIIEEFRANGGKVGGYFEGADLVLLTTTGARTGRQVTTPVMYLEDAGHHPAWYHNLRAHPEVTVELGTEKFRAKAATVTDPAERDRLYARMVEKAPQFAEYEKKTSRVIPVVTLDRIG